MCTVRFRHSVYYIYCCKISYLLISFFKRAIEAVIKLNIMHVYINLKLKKIYILVICFNKLTIKQP